MVEVVLMFPVVSDISLFCQTRESMAQKSLNKTSGDADNYNMLNSST
jgi:hypothetical protein